MKQLKLQIAVFASLALLIVACTTTAQRKAYNTLATTGMTEEASFETYLGLVAQGVIKTNDVPTVAANHKAFKILFDSSVMLAQGATNNTPTPPAVATAAQKVQDSINTAKTK